MKVNEYKPKLIELISPYEPKNIYNADEPGLFFAHYQQKSLAVKGEKCTGGKKVQTKTYSVIVWEYGGRNGKASRNWKNSKNQDVSRT
jgi:hypothetical protein